MKSFSHLKPHKVLILVGLTVIAAGFGFSSPKEPAIDVMAEESVERILTIRASQEIHTPVPPSKSELDTIRETIDWSDEPSPVPALVDREHFDVYVNVTKEYLEYVFEKFGYTGKMIDSGETTAIPPLFTVTIPQGWAEDESVQFKKSIFYRVILPLILHENEAVLRQRNRLNALHTTLQSGEPLEVEEANWLRQRAIDYKVIGSGHAGAVGIEAMENLLLRVDMVPPSMALGQAAYESGYATSRFAHSANALFGQWDWSANAIKPQQQRAGKGNYGIKAFEYPIDSVRAYIWNLNTHYRYEEFRQMRSRQRGDRKGRYVFDAEALAGTLLAYSERGVEYVKDLQGIMRFNDLQMADHLRLLEGEPIYFD